jgi:uncharacterized protein
VTTILMHLLAAYAVVAAPWLGRVLYQRTLRRIREGDPLAKIKMYRMIVTDQVITTALLLWLGLSGAILPARLGLGAPRSWWLSAGLTVMLAGLLIGSGFSLRRGREQILKKLKRAEALLPFTLDERRWFAAISIGAGISEELLFRGFGFYYLSLWFLHINLLECTLVTSLVFGLGHLYQGWKGILSTGVTGLIMAGLYVLSGNLLLPVVFHAIADYRVLLFFPPQTLPQTLAAEGAA